MPAPKQVVASGGSAMDIEAIVCEHHSKLCQVLEEWITSHKMACEAHASQQQNFLSTILSLHQDIVRHLQNSNDYNRDVQHLAHIPNEPPINSVSYGLPTWKGMSPSPGSGLAGAHTKQPSDFLQLEESTQQPVSEHASDLLQLESEIDAEAAEAQIALEQDIAGPSRTLVTEVETHDRPSKSDDKLKVVSARRHLMNEIASLQAGAKLLDGWKQSSGLHTVSKWVQNYKKHPAGWAALLMIHGVPEVTNRLRNKVENYAIYSALFLSMSVALLASPPEIYFESLEADTYSAEWWTHWIRMSVYLCGFAIGTGAHYTCILLGMAFSNALNETARDSDVYRLFARGKGFLATKKCQTFFNVGCCADFIAVAAAMCFYAHVALVFVLSLTIAGICAWIYFPTKRLLFSSASIVKYWREELGGKPDKDDPYDLPPVLHSFRRREAFEKLLAETISSDGEACLDLNAADVPQTMRPSLLVEDRSSKHSLGRQSVIGALF